MYALVDIGKADDNPVRPDPGLPVLMRNVSDVGHVDQGSANESAKIGNQFKNFVARGRIHRKPGKEY